MLRTELPSTKLECSDVIEHNAKCHCLQATFEAAQQPPVHSTKPGMKALKVLPGELISPLVVCHTSAQPRHQVQIPNFACFQA